MPSSSGPRNTAASNLVFALDTYDTGNCVTGLGCGGFNSSTQGVRNILGNTTLLYQNGLRISNRDFYTAFGISYPESAYGGDAANRDGLTPGYNVRSGGKTYGASRSLNVYVWNNDTNTWVPDSYFRGLRISGHCYDNYAGAETGWQNELNLFNGDYNNIRQAFPNSTWILVGSHACQMFDSTTINNMISLGAPSSTINSWTDGSAWREFVLVGTPGLGDGKAYGWAYENYPTNPAQVAHMNLSVTPRNLGVLSFDGTDDYLNLDSNIQSGFTAASYEFLIRPTALPGTGNYYQLYIQENSTWIALYNPSGTPFFGIDLGNGSGWFDNNGGNTTGAKTITTLYANTWYHLVYTWASGVVKVYLNGDLHSTTSTAQAANGRQNVMSLGGGTTPRNIGSRGGGNYWVGDMSVVNFYNYGLSADEVNKNYNNYKTRFNVFNPTYRYYEGTNASPYLSNWNNSTTYTMADFGGIPNVTAHGWSSGPATYTLTLSSLPTHTKVRYRVYWHLVDSLDNETNQLFIMNSGGGETEILRFTKVYNASPSISIASLPGTYTWSGPKTYTYRPWAGGAYNADGYIIVDSGWCDHTSSTFTARHVMGADQAQADEAEYLSHVEVLLF
jgi:hypothetical protein